MKTLLLVFAALAIGAHSLPCADTVSISGRVFTSEGEPVIGATVRLVGTKQGARTKKDGEFFIANVRAGEYSVQVSCIGHKSETAQISATDTVKNLKFVLEQRRVEETQCLIVCWVGPDTRSETDAQKMNDSAAKFTVWPNPFSNDAENVFLGGFPEEAAGTPVRIFVSSEAAEVQVDAVVEKIADQYAVRVPRQYIGHRRGVRSLQFFHNGQHHSKLFIVE